MFLAAQTRWTCLSSTYDHVEHLKRHKRLTSRVAPIFSGSSAGTPSGSSPMEPSARRDAQKRRKAIELSATSKLQDSMADARNSIHESAHGGGVLTSRLRRGAMHKSAERRWSCGPLPDCRTACSVSKQRSSTQRSAHSRPIASTQMLIGCRGSPTLNPAYVQRQTAGCQAAHACLYETSRR